MDPAPWLLPLWLSDPLGIFAAESGMVVRGGRIEELINPRALSPRVRGFRQAQSLYQEFTQVTLAG